MFEPVNDAELPGHNSQESGVWLLFAWMAVAAGVVVVAVATVTALLNP